MTTGPEKIFYSLSMVALAAAVFVLTPSQKTEVNQFTSDIKDRFTIATIQTFGDQPVLDAPKFVIDSINQFYEQSADAMIALLTPTHGEDEQLNNIAIQTFEGLKVAINSTRQLASGGSPQVLGIATEDVDQANLAIPANFMQEEAIHNIVPDNWKPSSSNIASEAPTYSETIASEPEKSTWISLKDAVTSQVYCVAIFNAEVNRYLGPCKSDYK